MYFLDQPRGLDVLGAEERVSATTQRNDIAKDSRSRLELRVLLSKTRSSSAKRQSI